MATRFSVCLRAFGWVTFAFSIAGYIGATPIGSWIVVESLQEQVRDLGMDHPVAADVVIVLGGAALSRSLPIRSESDVHGSGERVTHALALYRAGAANKIVISAPSSEAEVIKSLLVSWGVDSHDIFVGPPSGSTREDALSVKQVFAKQKIESGLLVTSAMHMPRAIAVFRRAGIPVKGAPADFVNIKADWLQRAAWLPGKASIRMTLRALREWGARLAYTCLGYA